ncbi:hypothetical protein Hanom_Chr12g01103381 [Helianthus anomalus]
MTWVLQIRVFQSFYLILLFKSIFIIKQNQIKKQKVKKNYIKSQHRHSLSPLSSPSLHSTFSPPLDSHQQHPTTTSPASSNHEHLVPAGTNVLAIVLSCRLQCRLRPATTITTATITISHLRCHHHKPYPPSSP